MIVAQGLIDLVVRNVALARSVGGIAEAIDSGPAGDWSGQLMSSWCAPCSVGNR